MWHQKALDLDMPPAAPKLIFLNNPRGIEESDDEDSDMNPEESDKENDGVPDINLSTRVYKGGSCGDK